MERPSSNKSAEKDRNLRELLDRLSTLSDEDSYQELMELDPKQLLELCSLESRIDFCDDVDFWQDYLIAQGYLLPGDFMDLIEALKEDGESEADVIKALFFGKIGERASIRGILIDQWNKLSKEGKSTKHLEKAILDLAYLSRQEDILHTRRNKKPYVFEIDFAVHPDKNEREAKLHYILDNIRDINYSELLEILINNDAVIKPKHEFWIRTLTGIEDFRDMHEESIVSVGDFLKEGDIVKLKLDLSKPKSFTRGRIQFSNIYLYYFDGEFLQSLTNNSRSDEFQWILPNQALPYLVRKNVKTRKDLQELYSDIPYTIGVVNPHGISLILNTKKKRPYFFRGHKFYVEN